LASWPSFLESESNYEVEVDPFGWLVVKFEGKQYRERIKASKLFEIEDRGCRAGIYWSVEDKGYDGGVRELHLQQEYERVWTDIQAHLRFEIVVQSLGAKSRKANRQLLGLPPIEANIAVSPLEAAWATTNVSNGDVTVNDMDVASTPSVEASAERGVHIDVVTVANVEAARAAEARFPCAMFEHLEQVEMGKPACVDDTAKAPSGQAVKGTEEACLPCSWYERLGIEKLVFGKGRQGRVWDPGTVAG
jgi:hypothetical protein